MTPPAREFERTFAALCSGKHQRWRVFADFCEMAAMSFAQVVEKDPAREERYMRIVGAYEPEEVQLLCKLLAHVVEGLDLETDFLGDRFQALELANHWKGQFFTPQAVSRLNAEVVVGDGADVRAAVEEKGFVTLMEPASGSGGMVIAFAGALLQRGINPQQHLHATAIDVDATAAYMTFVQLSLLHIPAVVYVGDSLRMEMREALYTPAHHLGLWDHRLRRAHREPEPATDAAPEIQPATPPARPQYDLFAA